MLKAFFCIFTYYELFYFLLFEIYYLFVIMRILYNNDLYHYIINITSIYNLQLII